MKDQILDKANEMFLSLGFKSVTMDDIAVALGISKKTIYQHYSNKNELVLASTEKLFYEISNSIDAIIAQMHNPIEEFFIVRQFIAEKTGNVTAATFHQLQKFFPEASATLHAMKFKKMYKAMCDNLERGIKEGLYRENLNTDFIGRIYFTGLDGIKNADVFPPAEFNENTLTHQFLEYHLRSISTSEGLKVLESVIDKNSEKK